MSAWAGWQFLYPVHSRSEQHWRATLFALSRRHVQRVCSQHLLSLRGWYLQRQSWPGRVHSVSAWYILDSAWRNKRYSLSSLSQRHIRPLLWRIDGGAVCDLPARYRRQCRQPELHRLCWWLVFKRQHVNVLSLRCGILCPVPGFLRLYRLSAWHLWHCAWRNGKRKRLYSLWCWFVFSHHGRLFRRYMSVLSVWFLCSDRAVSVCCLPRWHVWFW
jgi:hypothetical protein